jgi:hypothetical protein
MSRISAAARRELVESVGTRYRSGTVDAKRRMLDEFVAVTGYHRKHAIRILNLLDAGTHQRRGGRHPLYDEAVRQALIILWEASDRICGKRLKPLLPILLPALEGHGHLDLEDGVRQRVLTVSASTIDRLLTRTRDSAGHRHRRHQNPGLRRSIPIRTFADWRDPVPGCRTRAMRPCRMSTYLLPS